MEYVSYSLLKRIVKSKELSIADISKHLPKTFGDHRDFYPLATLLTANYVSCSLRTDKDDDPDFKSNLHMASMFYAISNELGPQKHMSFDFTISGAVAAREMIYATAKADLYFAELKQKRIDRVITLITSVTVGVLSALLTLLVKANLDL